MQRAASIQRDEDTSKVRLTPLFFPYFHLPLGSSKSFNFDNLQDNQIETLVQSHRTPTLSSRQHNEAVQGEGPWANCSWAHSLSLQTISRKLVAQSHSIEMRFEHSIIAITSCLPCSFYLIFDWMYFWCNSSQVSTIESILMEVILFNSSQLSADVWIISACSDLSGVSFKLHRGCNEGNWYIDD